MTGGLQHYLFLCAALAALGVIAMVSRRNASHPHGDRVLLNAAAIISCFRADAGDRRDAGPAGQGSGCRHRAAAADAAIALAIVIAIYQARAHIDATELNELKR